MTIIANMAASLNAKRNIDQLDNNPFDEFVRNRGRSGRTGSLALPNNSLLDFYDTQQEQCNSASLLLPPVNSNVIRRHSSHCCPMLDETHHQQQQQQQHYQQQSIKSNKNHFDTNTHHKQINKRSTAGLSSSSTIGTTAEIIVVPPPPPIPKRTFKGKFSNREQIEHHQQNKQQKRERIRGSSNSGRYRIDGDCSQESQYCNIEQTIQHQQQQPKPIKQSFDQTNFNYTINNSPETSSIVNKPLLSALFYNNKDKQSENKLLSSSINNRNNINKKQDINPTTNIMSKRQYQLSNKNQHNNYDTINNCEQNFHHNINNDDDDDDDEIDGIVDDCDDCDDGLENSVFDEPSSTPRTVNCFNNSDRNVISSLKIINHNQQNQIPNNNTIINNDFGGSMQVTTKLPSTTTMNNSRHSNRSSSDSNKSQITIDTGYISSNGSEKNLTSVESRVSGNIGNGGSGNSGNTNNDFRSRFSSVDTQSSLDSCLTEKTIDSPLSKESFRIDSGRSSSAAITTNNFEYNNYDLSSSGGCNNITNNVNYNNKIQGNNKNCSTIILPAVPMRKQFKNNNSNNMNSNSSNNRNRPIPPTPPFRSQHSIDSINCQIINQNNSIENINKNNVIMDNNDNGKKLTKFNQQQQQQQQQGSNPISFRNKFSTKNRPPPIVYHPKLHQRQDSSISSDSFSMTSSPGYNSKSMEVPLIQQHTTTRMTKNDKNHSENDNNIIVNYDNSKFGLRNQQQQKQYPSARATLRQDSTISNDSFSQTSSPSYNTKSMESPLLPSMKKYINTKQSFKIPNDTIQEHQDSQSIPSSPIIKSTSTPASLQTVVRFQNGTSNMSLQHRIINRRKSSVPYVKDGRLKFRLLQILINALALLAIAGGLVAYFNAYPTIKFINKTIITPIQIADTTDILTDKNPAPGICLPIIVKFCQTAHVPYNYTVFPNYIGHFGQLETQVDLESYDALVDVRCYELVSLFLCTLFVPKCGSTGTTVPPCKSLCTETMRRCGFFFDVFSLSLPDYLNCNLFTDHMNPEECVGNQQVKEVREESINPTCNGFLCDQTRCIPNDWRCDGHVDCLDQTDESNCEFCDENSIYCGEKRCMSQKHMCDGTIDCPYGQDERSCIRLSERNGDIGKGFLEIYKIQDNDTQWVPACITNWDTTFSPPAICSMLGYNSVTQHQLLKLGTGSNITTTTLLSAQRYSPDMYRKYQKGGKTNLIKEFSKCPTTGNYPVVELTCNNYECGKIRNKRYKQSKRIVGGHASNPGDWPFLAAILGGPEEIFYCAGVLIGDQWVLTASHCIGNHTLRDINDWTIQLGVTRRNSHTYYGQKVKVINVIPHPQYNTEIAHDNDIALFQLAKRVAFHEHLLPVCLPPPNLTELKAGTYCTVIGWGKREDKNLNKYYSSSPTSASYELSVNEVKVPVVKREICDEWLESSNITDGMICAGYADGGKDACQGDSGGPLLCPYPGERDKWFVGGIVSWGILCAHPKLPGVYANVPKYIPWIKNEISKYSKINNNNNNNHNNNNEYTNNNKKFIDNNYYNNKQYNYNNIKYNNNVETDDYN